MQENISKLFERLTNRAKQALIASQKLAESANHSSIGTEHLLYGLMKQERSYAAETVLKNAISADELRGLILEELPTKNTPSLQPEPSEELRSVLESAAVTAAKFRYQFIGTEHLLYALLKKETAAKKLLERKDLQPSQILKQIEGMMENFSRLPEMIQDELQEQDSPDTVQQPGKMPANTALDYFAQDLTAAAVAKKLDPVIGREREIGRVVQILNRRNKSNPLLIGEPGVGKTAIVEGLAQSIASESVPEFLIGKRILNLDLASVVAGSMFRGEFENRLKQIIEEAKEAGNIILFIDELHTLIGAGATTGSLDAANILKPALARADIAIIGATTPVDYKKYIENDPALERRFQTVLIEEPTPEATLEMLKGLKKYYEDHHGVMIDENALKSACELSERYLPERRFPDKAIDVLDETAARLRALRKPSESTKVLRSYERDIAQMEESKVRAVLNQDFALALKMKLAQDELRKKVQLLKSRQLKRDLPSKRPQMTVQEIIKTVALNARLPENHVSSSSDQVVARLESGLKRAILGQDEILSQVAATIRRGRAGLGRPNRPIGSFLFMGPTGVGKTETAKALANHLFQSEHSLIRVDMSEFMERHNIARLIGAPAGYVGYEEGGRLTESVRRRPYSVILFDEIEKAHPDITNILLQILDDGRLTDASGRVVSFKNTVIIMTSNIGSGEFSRLGFGFSEHDHKTSAQAAHAEVSQRAIEALKNRFSPELLNRIDAIMVFRSLSDQALKRIIENHIAEIRPRLKNKQVELQVSRELIDHLHKLSRDQQQGARQVRKLIQDYIENPLSEHLLRKNLGSATIKIHLEGDAAPKARVVIDRPRP